MSAALVWSALTSRAAGPLASALALALGCFLVVALLAHAGERSRAEMLVRDRDGWKASAQRWEASARGLRAAFDEAEALRRGETAAARAAVALAEKACEARVATARRSARAIETIIKQEVIRDANGCPARRIVPVERLRDALAPSG